MRFCAAFCLPRRRGKVASQRRTDSRSSNSSSGANNGTLEQAGSTGSSVSDSDATEQRVQGSTVAVEDLEICRHVDGRPWLLGSGGHAAAPLVHAWSAGLCGLPISADCSTCITLRSTCGRKPWGAPD
jgi:hypothetical protein